MHKSMSSEKGGKQAKAYEDWHQYTAVDWLTTNFLEIGRTFLI